MKEIEHSRCKAELRQRLGKLRAVCQAGKSSRQNSCGQEMRQRRQISKAGQVQITEVANVGVRHLYVGCAARGFEELHIPGGDCPSQSPALGWVDRRQGGRLGSISCYMLHFRILWDRNRGTFDRDTRSLTHQL